MLALTFADKEDYSKIQEDDRIDIVDLVSFAADKPLTLVLKHKDGSSDTIKVNHTYNKGQIGWFKAGSALNLMGGQKSTVSRPARKAAPKAKKVVKALPAKKASAKKKVTPKKANKKVVKLVAKKVVRKVAKKAVKKAARGKVKSKAKKR